MSTKIYYFSGTGNSLAVAREIENNLDDKGSIIPMSQFENEDSIVVYSDTVGFVFPVYFMDIPDIVTSFIRKLSFKTKPYIFAAATCNGIPGRSLYDLNKCLEEKDQTLSAGFVIDMPGNAIVTPPDVISERLDKYKLSAAEIAEEINNCKINRRDDKPSVKTKILSSACKHLGKNMYLNPKNAAASSDCIGCGLCTKVCPQNNIKLVNNKPSWGNNCAGCLACFHWCPKKAITGGSMLNKRDQYHNPEISAKDMILK